jgi:hypothetical protein
LELIVTIVILNLAGDHFFVLQIRALSCRLNGGPDFATTQQTFPICARAAAFTTATLLVPVMLGLRETSRTRTAPISVRHSDATDSPLLFFKGSHASLRVRSAEETESRGPASRSASGCNSFVL